MVQRRQICVSGSSPVPHAPGAEAIPTILASVVVAEDLGPTGGVSGISCVIGGDERPRRAIAVEKDCHPSNGADQEDPFID